MAAEQLSRGDNKTKEREVHVEKERVPQLASRFEAIAAQGKATEPITLKPTIAEKTEHSQRTGGTSKVREDEEKRRRIGGRKQEEIHQLADQFESLADKVRDKKENQRDRQARVGEEQRISEKTEQRDSKQRNEGQRDDDDDGGILGAIGETIYEIAQTSKEIVFGGGDETEKQRGLGFELGQEEEEKGLGYEQGILPN